MRLKTVMLLVVVLLGLITTSGIIFFSDKNKDAHTETLELSDLAKQENDLSRKLDELRHQAIKRYSKFSKEAFYEGGASYNRTNPEKPFLTALQRERLKKINEMDASSESAWLQLNRTQRVLYKESLKEVKSQDNLYLAQAMIKNTNRLLDEMMFAVQSYDQLTGPQK